MFQKKDLIVEGTYLEMFLGSAGDVLRKAGALYVLKEMILYKF
jgi:hypothetical protein